MADRTLFAEGTPVTEATDALLAEGLGDGLPVVVPTEAGWARMLEGCAHPDSVLGLVPPLFGELTTAACGYFALLAGCRPVELPVVLAAVRAALEPEFNLLGVQTTTGTAAVAVVVHGPVVTELGFNPGANALGPGNRVNACVGRAVALTLAGVGGALPGVTDMATLGQPGRYTFCLPEHPDTPTGWPSLATRLAGASGLGASGLGASGVGASGVGAVTVLAVGGTAEVLPRGGGGTLPELLDPLAAMLAGAALASGNPARMAGVEQYLVLPPEVTAQLTKLGLTAESLAPAVLDRGNALLRASTGGEDLVVAEAVHPIVTGGAGVKMLHLPGWMGGSHAVTRAITARSDV